ncbi:MAG: ABC transporter permease [Acidobacteria bacterium]|nr:ABC transporter permease [Acidobacteriota bacterium]
MKWHFLKMVWNRKRTNLLIILEIFVSFLILFAVVAFGSYCFNNYRLPLGFSYQNLWVIHVDPKTYNYGPSILPEQALQEKYRQVLSAVRNFPRIRGMAAAAYMPYSDTEVLRFYEKGNRRIYFLGHEASDDFKDVMNLQVVRGRWFEPSDDALNWHPIVVNEEFVRLVFGSEDPLGKTVPNVMNKLRPGGTAGDPYYQIEGRIVGVIRGFRNEGEYSIQKPYVFCRRSLNKPFSDMLSNIAIKLNPGTPRSFEEKLIKALNSAAKDWSFRVYSLEDLRKQKLRVTELAILLAAVVAGFLMLMVAFGLLGVLWQSVTQRTTEIGLRRAQGATAGDVYRQILGELFFITTLALIPGILLIVQFPLLNLIGDLKTSIYLYSIALSMILIYALTLICGLYPGWLATRVRPAEALHYE